MKHPATDHDPVLRHLRQLQEDAQHAHYLQVTDDHMRSATECATVPGCTDLIRDADASDDKGTSSVAAERCNPLHLQGVTEKWAGPDSNRGPNDYESSALTAELPARSAS